MIDLRGAVLSGPVTDGLYTVLLPGFMHPAWLESVPGVMPPTPGAAGRPTFEVPVNLLPPKIDRLGQVPNPQGITLRDYQREAIAFALQTPLGCVLALDVGLGKTVIASAFAAALEYRPFIIVGPLIAATAWATDPANCFGLRIASLRTLTPEPDKIPKNVDGYFINYEILPAWQLWLRELRPRLVIVDEAHIMRTARRKDGLAVRGLCLSRHVKKRLLLTATPVVNRVSDLWTLLDAAQPRHWGTRGEFVLRYAGGKPSEYHTGLDETNETNVHELQRRLGSALFRRSRYEVRKELPPFERRVFNVEPKTLSDYDWRQYLDAKRHITSIIRERDGRLFGVSLQQAALLHQRLSVAKIPTAIDRALSYVQDYGSVVVFCWYKETATAIAQALRDHTNVLGPITSAVAKKKRDSAAKQFRALAIAAGEGVKNDGAAFVATLGTAGMSLNELSASPIGLFVDLYWVPATLLQAEGRIHREGQRQACAVEYVLVKGTIDEVMYEHLARKSRVAAGVVDDAAGVSLCESLGGTTKQTKDEAFREMLAGLMAIEELEH